MGVCSSILCPQDREKFRTTDSSHAYTEYTEVQDLNHWKAMYSSDNISNSALFFPDAKVCPSSITDDIWVVTWDTP
eukprot:3816189-Pyramimonas_sp.AAC.1